jgi:RNA polymerase sigma-70 factor (ECF subfamily)
MDRSDHELLRDIAAGDQSALAEFYDRHAPRTLGLLLHWLRQRSDAEDVLQEVFWQVWRRADQYDAFRASPVGWLVLLARSRSLDHLRQRQTKGLLELSLEPATRDDPHDHLELGESSARLRQALTLLPDEQRRAVVLAFYDGLTYEQVARREAVPVGTAKTRIRLGIRRLRLELRDAEEQ